MRTLVAFTLFGLAMKCFGPSAPVESDRETRLRQQFLGQAGDPPEQSPTEQAAAPRAERSTRLQDAAAAADLAMPYFSFGRKLAGGGRQ